MNAVILLRIVLIAFTICSALFLIVVLIKHKDEIHFKKGITLALIGLFTNMLDTWGIGCFATQSACFKFTKSTNDEIIPGTLNVGNTIPVALEGIQMGSENRSLCSVCRSGNSGCCTCMQERRRRSIRCCRHCNRT